MKRLIIASLIAFTAAASLAQEAAETIDVRVVNVDVVVRDRSGKPVTGLTKNDFQIFENGQPREITNLYEVRAPAATTAAKAPVAQAAPAAAPTAAPVETRPRNIVMFVDNYSLASFRREKVLQSLHKFIGENLTPNDRVMLVLATQQVKVITAFTSDRKTIEDGIETLRKQVSGAQNRASALDTVKSRITQFIEAAKEPHPRITFIDYYRMSETLVDA